MTHISTKTKIEMLETQISYMAAAIRANYRMNSAIAERIWEHRRELEALKQQKADSDFAHYLCTGRFPE